ncbi:aminotransferase class IV [Robertkochia solimangrovi]|uniref:aminotransferase class IV n=1 Tax=Robertkochia solimangrovi TaxID=2213046 RepID=UPI00117C1AA1|nr:aminotransferase class IV [Robertkochia solimangrovi]TRZ42865.1 aminotransferase class IV [Robertkochia solimangrovi]
MVNFDGELYSDEVVLFDGNNRAFRYGDALFETIRVVNSKIFFWEPHYLRLMASMRILRMEIPMTFTMEYLKEEIERTLNANDLDQTAARVRITVFRNGNGLYTPDSNEVSWLIDCKALDSGFYQIAEKDHEVELFKDHYLVAGLLGTVKSTNRIINTLAGVFAQENGYQNCLLLNHDKQVTEAINGNLFVVKGNTIKTPPLTDGCINGIMRKQLIDIIGKTDEFELSESSVSPFELQKADELFITNVISGITPVTRYRKKQYGNSVASKLLGRLNAVVRLT